MKILYISNTNIMAGSNVALLHIIRQMRMQGHEVYVAIPTDQGALPERLKEMGCPYVRLNMRQHMYPVNHNPIGYLPRLFLMLYTNYTASRRLEKFIRSYAPDIVHTNVGPMNIAVGICQRLHIPHVWHHREYLDIGLNYHFFPSHAAFMKQTHAEGNYNLCITKGVFAHSHFREGIDRVIYDGVFPQSAVHPYRAVEKEKYILFVGRIVPVKGTLDLIRVFADFHKRHPDYKLLIAGEYKKLSYPEACFRMVKEKGLEPFVEFLGNRNDIYPLMEKAAMLVVPSRFEGFGFITTEAMLNGCPVIGRDNGGTKEQFDRGLELTGAEIGLRFSNDREMLEAMCKVLETDTTAMCKRAHRVVTENYTVEHHVAQLKEYYHFVLRHYANHYKT